MQWIVVLELIGRKKRDDFHRPLVIFIDLYLIDIVNTCHPEANVVKPWDPGLLSNSNTC